jgi:hypothetical protein
VDERQSTRQIGEALGTNSNIVNRALRRHGIQIRTRPRRINQHAAAVLGDRDELEALYRVWTVEAIAEELGVSAMTVSNAVRAQRIDPDGRLRYRHASRARKRAIAPRKARQDRERKDRYRATPPSRFPPAAISASPINGQYAGPGIAQRSRCLRSKNFRQGSRCCILVKDRAIGED